MTSAPSDICWLLVSGASVSLLMKSPSAASVRNEATETDSPPRSCRGRGTVPGLPSTSATVNSGCVREVPTTPSLKMPRFRRAPTSNVNLLVVRAFWSKVSLINSPEVLALARLARQHAAAAEVRHARDVPERAPDLEGSVEEAVAVRHSRLPRREAHQVEAGLVERESVVGVSAGHQVLEVDDRVDAGVRHVADRHREPPVGGHQADHPRADNGGPGRRQGRDPADQAGSSSASLTPLVDEITDSVPACRPGCCGSAPRNRRRPEAPTLSARRARPDWTRSPSCR